MLASFGTERISNDVTKLDSGPIPQTAGVSSSLKDYENQKVVLSFEPYKQNQCRLHKLEKTEAKHLTTELKKISGTLSKHFRHQDASRIACKPVHSSGEYAELFTGLPEDVDEILEVDYTGTGRIFGFLIHNTFNVVAIAREHLR